MTVKLLIKENLFYKLKLTQVWLKTVKNYSYIIKDGGVILDITVYNFSLKFYRTLFYYGNDYYVFLNKTCYLPLSYYDKQKIAFENDYNTKIGA
jgi:hypothetical protein